MVRWWFSKVEQILFLGKLFHRKTDSIILFRPWSTYIGESLNGLVAVLQFLQGGYSKKSSNGEFFFLLLLQNRVLTIACFYAFSYCNHTQSFLLYPTLILYKWLPYYKIEFCIKLHRIMLLTLYKETTPTIFGGTE